VTIYSYHVTMYSSYEYEYILVRVQLYSHRSGREGVTRFFIHSGLTRFTDPPEDSQAAVPLP
jgi:hypothetical protein